MGSRLSTLRSQLRAKRGGFALLIVVTLLAFVVVLLLGLAVYARVETAVAGNTQRQAQARENALLALNLALAQLQTHAGPDTRVTASAAFLDAAANPSWTGVWDATGLRTWLVSGNERVAPGDPPAVKPEDATANRTPLMVFEKTVGQKTVPEDRRANYVDAPLQDILSPGIPGTAPAALTRIGRYAWWVGDQGVKAPVGADTRALAFSATAPPAETISYAPFDAVELRRRIRQQITLGAGPAEIDGAGNALAVFEPRASSGAAVNSPLTRNALAAPQLAFFRTPAGAPVGLAPVQRNFHAWTADNAAVLADTRDGGLRRDLSLRPDLLGPAFAAWVDYTSYMESPTSPEALRRRYVMRPATSDARGIHPVLSSFFIGFNIRTQPASLSSNTGSQSVAPLQLRARCSLSLWNPYSASLAPERLRVEIHGLPEVVRVENDTTPRPAIPIPLRDRVGSPMKLDLPWDASGGEPDTQSWLPGRLYSWVSEENKTPISDLYPTRFYRRDLGDAGQGIWLAGSSATVDGDNECHLVVEEKTALRIELFVVRATGDERIATFESPEFDAFDRTTPQPIYENGYQFGFLFRLADPGDGIPGEKWLQEAGRDPREDILPAAAYVFGAPGPQPGAYEGYNLSAFPDRLLDRVQGTSRRSYNEDVPVFELPRAPLLSVGSLQHFPLPGERPFAIGNSWGRALTFGGAPANATFDRYFFSGLAREVSAAFTDEMRAAEVAFPLPNPFLAVARRKSDGAPTLLRDLLGQPASAAAPGEGFSSRHLLQRGAFNLNSTSAAAWLAVLRGTRYADGVAFPFLDAEAATGTAPDDKDTRSLAPAEAVFYRFPQSAQETFLADDPVEIDVSGTKVLSTYAASSTVSGADPDPSSAANTHLFRRGMRALSASETAALVTAIAARAKVKQADSGPFRSVEDFLAPRALFADAAGGEQSAFEAAIADAGLNAKIPEFSSQFLTQADIMTALAPVLFARSDTFLIRAYGEAVNPATNATEGRAWCEATVQRVPEYFDPKIDDADTTGDYAETPPASLTSELNKLHGRRFKVISFRWLTRSDI